MVTRYYMESSGMLKPIWVSDVDMVRMWDDLALVKWVMDEMFRVSRIVMRR